MVAGLYPSAGLYPGAGVRPAKSLGSDEGVGEALRVVERPPMRMYIMATPPGSATSRRWGEDSPNADEVLSDVAHSSSANGGYKDFTASLGREPGVDYRDMKRGTRIDVFGAGRRLVGQYRLERAPQVAGEQLVISPAAAGYEVALTDNTSAQEIYLDADISGWGEPTASRKVAVGNDRLNQNAQVQLLAAGTPDSSEPASFLRTPAISHAWATINNAGGTVRDLAESWYDADGIPLGSVSVSFGVAAGVDGGVGDANWHNRLFAVSVPDGSSNELLKDFKAKNSGDLRIAIGPGRYFLLLQDYYGPEKDEDGNWSFLWQNSRVTGRHSVPIYGTTPRLGLLASDVAADAITRWAPSIKFTTGPYGTIKPTRFLIPHLVFKDLTTPADIIQQACRFELPEYGVWAGPDGEPTFYMNPRGQREGRNRWRVRAKDAQLEDTGQQLDQVFNGVIVQGVGTDGNSLRIGPPGSGLRVTSARLSDEDPLNPANQAGIKHYAKIQMRGVCTLEGMEEAGEALLEQSKLLDGSGKATLTGYVEDETGREWPYYCVQGGDEIEFLGSSIPGYRYIVNADPARSGRGVSVDIDAPPDSYEALMERLNAEFIGIALGAA